VNEELSAGQVWHFHCEDVRACDDYYLLLRSLDDLTFEGMWEVFDLLEGELAIVCPCGAGVWELIG